MNREFLRRPGVAGAAMAVFCFAAVPGTAPETVAVEAAQSDLDEFMRQVLARRDENWKKLQQYVLDERETIDARGPSEAPMFGQRRKYRWFIRDGFFVRSPVSIDGVNVSDAERVRYEENYYKKARERDAKRGEDDRGPGTTSTGASSEVASNAPPTSMEQIVVQVAQPEFVNSAYFLKFKFEEGKYALVGREKFEGREVLRIEYYPAKLFSDSDRAKPADPAKPNRDRTRDAEVERLMNKNSLVTLWVEPKDRQIVKYVFDNIEMGFLPAAWLMRIDDLTASMTMSQPFKDVWLPKGVDLTLKVTLALGTITFRYQLEYMDYQEASTSGRIRKGGGGQ